MAVPGKWLDSISWEVFSNLNGSVTPQECLGLAFYHSSG